MGVRGEASSLSKPKTLNCSFLLDTEILQGFFLSFNRFCRSAGSAARQSSSFSRNWWVKFDTLSGGRTSKGNISTRVHRFPLTRCPQLRIVVRMAEFVNVVQAGFDCQMCGHAWVPRGERKPPRRCPNKECRSMRWDAEKYPNARPPAPPSPGGGFDHTPIGAANGDLSLPRTRYRTLRIWRHCRR